MAPSFHPQRQSTAEVSGGNETEGDDPVSPSVQLAQALLRIESITPNDGGCQAMLATRLNKLGFCCEEMKFEDVTNLWAVREGGREGKSLVFVGHTDVVPTGPHQKWSFPPFGGVLDNGSLHGRGAADMKGAIACFVVACERFVESKPHHGGSIGLIITSDEEGIARWGTREVISELTKRGTQIDMCIVGEPSSVAKCGDTIKIGRRGSLSGKLIIHGKQGHIAYPHLARNPLHDGLGVLKELVELEWDQGSDTFPPTTFQISNINGGTGATNVIPGHKTVHFNFRYSPETNDEELKNKVESLLDEHNVEYEIHWNDPAYPYETTKGTFVEAVKKSVLEVTDYTPKVCTSGGTSDGRFVSTTGAKVVEIGLVNATIHQLNERVPISDLDTLTDIYLNLLERLFS